MKISGCRGGSRIWPAGLALGLSLLMLAGLGACAGAQKRKAAAENHLNLGIASLLSGIRRFEFL